MNSLASRPLCVDLDGSLCRSDTLVEGFLALLKAEPLRAMTSLTALRWGRAALKQRLAALALPDFGSLPWRQDLLDWLRGQQAAGRRLVLCTGSDQRVADAVAAHHAGLFESVLASDGRRNLTGSAKRALLDTRYGEQGYDYVGNEWRDLKVWAGAVQAVVVEATPRLTAAAAAVTQVEREFAAAATPRWQHWARAMRPHQWVKNLLVLLPLLLSHKLDAGLALHALIAFAAFSLCASSAYLLNDLLDLRADRRHPSKRLRPFASATLPLLQGLLAAPPLLLVSLALAAVASMDFFWVLLLYYVLTLAYSLRLKQLATLDVMTLAALYTLRIIGGALAVGVPLSFWLLALSMFLFLSLAVAKRYTELHFIKGRRGRKARGRGYEVDDLPLLRNLGISSGYVAVLVLALYVNSPESQALYRHPKLIWLICPLLLYWITRVWITTHRGGMHDDPIVYALRDATSRNIGLLIVLVGLAAGGL